MVPSVECGPPPSRFWSTTTAMLRFSIKSAAGCGYRGMKLRKNILKFSVSSLWDSLAIVSNAIDNLPDPDTPVKTVILRFGMRSERLFD